MTSMVRPTIARPRGTVTAGRAGLALWHSVGGETFSPEFISF